MWVLVGLNLWLLGMLMICLHEAGPWPLDEFLALMAWPITLPIARIERRIRHKEAAKWLDDDGEQSGRQAPTKEADRG